MPKQHFLLIEDDQVLGHLYRQLLQEAGFMVSWVQSAQAALKSLQENVFDLILLDVMLPEMSGLEFLEKTDRLCSSTVVMTNLDQLSLRDEFIRKGVRGYVIKSDHTPDTFLTAIQGFVDI